MEAKLHAPRSRQVWVQRAQLIRYLADAAARLVLVDAPAGFGKTTLVAQWRASAGEGRRFAWVSLDRGDDDPDNLWWHVVSALQRACPEIDGDVILTALRATQDVAESVLPILLNQLAAVSVPVVLVLDDYHEIKNGSCHDQIAFLLRHLPGVCPDRAHHAGRSAPPAGPPAGGRRDGRDPATRTAAPPPLIRPRSCMSVRASSSPPSQPGRPRGADRGIADRGILSRGALARGHPSPGAFVRQFAGDHRSWSTSWPRRSSTASQTRSSSSWPGRPSWPGSTPRCAMPSPARRLGGRRRDA